MESVPEEIEMCRFKTSQDNGVLCPPVLLICHRAARRSWAHEEMTVVVHEDSLPFFMDDFEKIAPGQIIKKKKVFMVEEF